MDKMDMILKQAFDVLAKEEYDNSLKNIPKHRFSLRFRWRMHRMTFRMKQKEAKESDENHASLTALYRTVSRKRLVLIILILMLLVSGTLLAAKPLLYWLYNRYVKQQEDHVEIMNQEDTASSARTGFRKYKIKELPKGYHLFDESFDEEFQEYQADYYDEEDNILSLRQFWKEEEDLGKVTLDSGDMENVEVNKFTGYYVVDHDTGSFILSDGIYVVIISGNCSKEALMEITLNLKLKEEI